MVVKTRQYNFEPIKQRFDGFSLTSCPLTWTGELVTLKRREGLYSGVDTYGHSDVLKTGNILPSTPYTRWDIFAVCSGARNWVYKPGWFCGQNNFVQRTRILSWPLSAHLISASECYSIVEPYLKNYEEVKSRALGKYFEGFDALTFLVELKDAAKMVLGVWESAKKLLAKKPIKGKVKDFANAWLEWRYGWRLLYKDLKEIVDAINKKEKTTPISTLRSELRNTHSTKHAWPWANANYGASTLVDETIEISENFLVRFKDSRLSVRAYVLPPLTAWEVIPYSFVVDKIIDVGSWIKSICASLMLGTDQYTASYGIEAKLNRVFTPGDFWVSPTGPFSSYSEEGYGWLQYVLKQRRPEKLAFHGPLFPLGKYAGWQHLIDLIAMIIQKIGK